MDRAFGRTDRGGHFSFGFLGAAAALSLLLVPGLRGQLVTNVAAVPDNGKPPVIFLNGYQFGCTDRGTFAGTFGIADQVLAQDVRAVLFFNNCEVAPNVSIEELGNAFGRFLGSLKYADGRSVPQVDVVAHSMGGMIVRSYLAGKQPQRGSFSPPADTRIRKVIFLAVPFFGAVAVEVTGAPDIQSTALQIGSAFVFDLGTWNQNNDDLRGVDAIGVVATGGSGLSSGVPRFDDSTVSVTSGSLEWYLPGRTRIATGVCHTILTGFFTVGCTNPAVSVAQITSDQHDSAKIIRSFLNGTSEWQSVGQSPAGNDFLKDRGGVALQFRDRTDQIISIDSASATGAGMLKIRNREIAWNENVPGQPPLRISATSGSTTITADIPVASGQTKAFIVTTGGPGVGAVIPNFADVFPRAVAPGSFISIYGSSLATSTATAGGLPYPVSLGGAEVRMNDQPIALQYVSDQQINAVVPDSLTGLVKLQVRTANGQRTVNVMVEPAVPALSASAVDGTSMAVITTTSPARAGAVVTFYLTGLGATERRGDGYDWARLQPAVLVGGQACAVLFAGRAPGFVGLDQLNCQLSASLAPSNTTPVIVTSGRRTATTTIPIR